jgi:hypothetical protein
MHHQQRSTSRARTVARWFGISATDTASPDPLGPIPPIPLAGGAVVLVTGPSGAGKSTLLRRLRAQHPRAAWTDFAATRLPPRALVVDAMTDAMTRTSNRAAAADDADDRAIAAALESLSRVGLGEVWTYLRPTAELSEGQRWRLRLALTLARIDRRTRNPFPNPGALNPPTHAGTEPARRRAGAVPGPGARTTRDAAPVSERPLLCPGVGRDSETSLEPRDRAHVLAADEFAAPLDRVTALVASRALRRAVDARPHLCALLATTRDDLHPALQPNLTIHCDFGQIQITHH